MSDYGIKVVNAGTSVLTTDIRDQIMNSQYSMFKYHSDGTVTTTISAGGTIASGTIAHNLGYVPTFIAYDSYNGDTLQRITPSLPYGISFDYWTDAYIGTANLVLNFHSITPYGQKQYTGDINDIHEELWTGSAGLICGNPTGGGKSSAVRFSGVTIAKGESLTSANLQIKDVFSGPTTSNTKYKVYGIDEDDVGDGFDWTYTKTTAVDTREATYQSSSWNFENDVLDQVNEIINRAGWSSGNHMGFIFNDNSSPDNSYVGDSNSSTIELTVVGPTSGTITFRGIIFKDKII